MVYNAINATRQRIHSARLMAFSTRQRMPWSTVTVLNRLHQVTCVSKYQKVARTLYTVYILVSQIVSLKKITSSILFFSAKGWKTTIRRCASRSDFSVSWGCRYYIDEVGLYVETCYCSDRDGCNSSQIFTSSKYLIISFITLALFAFRK
jgi:hypothetical protein